MKKTEDNIQKDVNSAGSYKRDNRTKPYFYSPNKRRGKIQWESLPFRTVATATTGVTMDDVFRLDGLPDAARYAAYIQMARDTGDYEEADTIRNVVLGYHYTRVQSGKDYTTVTDGVWVKYDDIRVELERRKKSDEIISKFDKERKEKRDAKFKKGK